MGIYRIPLSGDTFITTESVSGNGGADPVLNVAAKYVEDDGTKYISRILGIADFSSNSDIITKINNGYIPNPNTNTTVTATLKMFNVLHSEVKAMSFDLNIHQVTSEWDEGGGIGFNEGNDLLMSGYANYKQRKANTNWTSSGGDYYNVSNSATQSFDTGDEDLSVNITPMVKDWISGASSNYGFIIKMTDIAENLTGSTSASLDYFRKSFYARETHSLKWPRIEFVWDDQIKDYRNFVTIGSSAYLYFYNISNNKYIDLSGTGSFPGTVAIQGATSNSSTSWSSVSGSLSSLTAKRIATGIYRILIPELPYSVYNSFTSYRDNWTITSAVSAILSSSTSFLTVISPFNSGGFSDINYSRLSINIPNIQSEYIKGLKTNLRLFIKDLSSGFSVLTATSTAFNNTIFDNAYWRVNTSNNETDIDWQILNFDKNGNFLTLDTNNLTRGINYKIDFKINDFKGQELYFDGKYIPTNFRII